MLRLACHVFPVALVQRQVPLPPFMLSSYFVDGPVADLFGFMVGLWLCIADSSAHKWCCGLSLCITEHIMSVCPHMGDNDRSL